MSLTEKIVVIADIFSALTGKRSYKDSMPKEKVISIMQQMADHNQISKEIVKVLFQNYEEISGKVEEDCREIIHNYEEIKVKYQKISEKFTDL